MQNHKYSINYIIFLLNLQHLFGFFHSTYKHNQYFLILSRTVKTKHHSISYLPFLLFPLDAASPWQSPTLLLLYIFYILRACNMSSTEWANRKQFISTFLQNCRLYDLSVLTISASINLQIARSSYTINQKFPIK